MPPLVRNASGRKHEGGASEPAAVQITAQQQPPGCFGSSIWILSRVVSSPSARKVWIEISFCPNWFVSIHVTFREEGVD